MAWRLEAFQFGKEHGLARIFQHLAHVARNALLYVQKYLAITGSAQCVDVGLRIALVFAAQLLGKRDVLDQALLPHFSQRERRELFFRFGGAQGIDGGGCDIVEALRLTGAEVEDAGFVRVVEEKQIDLDHVFHRDAVAQLPAVRITVAAFEQLDLAFDTKQKKKEKNNQNQTANVRLTLAVNVEIAQPDDLRAALFQRLR